MKRRLYSFLFFLLFGFALPALSLEARELAGNYELRGVMEMAGELQVFPTQKYVATFSYGAADWAEEGDWKAEGDGLTLSNGHITVRNSPKIPLFLPSGLHFSYQLGKLRASRPGGDLVFIDSSRTPSSKGEPGEGRMRVKGKVTQLDDKQLTVKMKAECLMFNVKGLFPEVLRKAQVGKNIDTEIPFSAMIGGGSCGD